MKRSFLHGGVNQMTYASIPELLDEFTAKHPDKEAYVFKYRQRTSGTVTRKAYSLKQISEDSLNLASILLNEGLEPGDRIAIYGQPSKEWLDIEYAVLRIKILLIRVPNTLIKSEDFAQFLKRYKCKFLFLDPAVLDDDHLEELIHQFTETSTITDKCDKNYSCRDYPRTIVLLREFKHYKDKVLSLNQLLQSSQQIDHDSVVSIQNTIGPEDPALVYPTSGTTGVPKLVVYSHLVWILLVNVVNDMFACDGKHSDICLFNNRPYSWAGSFVHWPVISPVKLVSIDPSLLETPDDIIRYFREESITAALIPVFMMHAAIKRDCAFPPSLRCIMSSGENVTDSVMKTLLQKVEKIVIIYACTEVCGAVTSGHLEDIKGTESAAMYKPLPGCSIKVIDSQGQVVTPGQPGTILIKSGASLICYLDDPASTNEVRDINGWVNTRDVGIIHPTGHLQIIGRMSDMISKGSCKIYPITIEKMLMLHNKISSAVVVGLPDEVYGQEIAACVVPEADTEVTQEELIEHCKQHGTVTYGLKLYPELFMIIPQIPCLPSGKADRSKIKLMIEDEKLQKNC